MEEEVLTGCLAGGGEKGFDDLQRACAARNAGWYAKTFGGVPGKRGNFDAAALPGTKGRSLDHIGFEVKGLEAFLKKLEAAGVKIEMPYRQSPNSTTAIAFLNDPWGTYIELTENLAPAL